MASKKNTIETKTFRVKPDSKINLDKISTKPSGPELSKEDAKSMLDASRTRLAEIQDVFYAHNQYAVLIIFQAMDAAGKDGAVNTLCRVLIRSVLKFTALRHPTQLSLITFISGDISLLYPRVVRSQFTIGHITKTFW